MSDRNGPFFVYLLYCPVIDKSYVGQTSHLILRFGQHQRGEVISTKAMKRPACIHWEMFGSRSDAMKREKFYKSGRGYEMRMVIVEQNRSWVRGLTDFTRSVG